MRRKKVGEVGEVRLCKVEKGEVGERLGSKGGSTSRDSITLVG